MNRFASDEDHIKTIRKMGNHTFRWSDEDLLQAVRDADAVGINTIAEYQVWCTKNQRPTFRTLVMRFGGWTEAREKAGLPVRPGHGRWRTSNAQHLDAVVRAARQLGHLPTESEYDEVRKSVNGRAPEWPCTALIRGTLGSWSGILKRVQRELQ